MKRLIWLPTALLLAAGFPALAHAGPGITKKGSQNPPPQTSTPAPSQSSASRDAALSKLREGERLLQAEKVGDALVKMLEAYLELEKIDGAEAKGVKELRSWLVKALEVAELKDEARLSLMKLGALIMQRKDSEFVLEGHTDTIGDEQYNLALSVNRATAIRNWLLDALRLDPARIKVKGLNRKVIMRGDKDHCGRFAIAFGKFARNAEAIELRHGHVEQHEVGLKLLGQSHSQPSALTHVQNRISEIRARPCRNRNRGHS